jgi:hypothetical protein
MPITANIIQTAKQTVNAIVLEVTTETCFWRRLGMASLLLPGTVAQVRPPSFDAD